MRLAFEQLGPVFIKLGQLLATRPDLIPQDFCDEFKKLQDAVPPLPYSEIEQTLKDNFKQPIKNIFLDFDENPIAAASIAQVHKATLITGEKVVVKLQRPHITQVIHEDISVMRYFAHILEKYIQEAQAFSPKEIVNEFSRSIELETNFIVEANNINKMAQNFCDDPSVKFPIIYEEFLGEKVLVMENIQGTRFSSSHSLPEDFDQEKMIQVILNSYLKMVFIDGYFHGDLHAGNMFLLPKNRLGLIDFGIVGRLNPKERSSIRNMLLALALEDYEALAYEYSDISPYVENLDISQFARELRDLMSPYHGLNIKKINSGQLMIRSATLANKYNLRLSSNLIMFFRSTVNIDGVLRSIKSDFDFLNYFSEHSETLSKMKYDPQRILKDSLYFLKDTNSLILSLPRQIKQILKRFSSRDFSFEVSVNQLSEINRTLETSSLYIFWGIIFLGLIISSTLFIIYETGPLFWGLPVQSLVSYGIIFVVMIYFFLKRK